MKKSEKRRNKKISNKSRIKVRARYNSKTSHDLSLFVSKSYFIIDGAQLYLILQSLYYTLKRLGDTEKVVSWKSKGLSTEKRSALTTTDNSLSPPNGWYKIKIFD